MNRYERVFGGLKSKNEGAFIPFVVLGDPDFETSKKILSVLVRNADCLELGFPFSDPIADGPRIQAADQRALISGVSVSKCFELVKYVRGLNDCVPIGLLVYYNLVFNMGVREFVRRAVECGVDGLLIADLPFEESGFVNKVCREFGLSQIFIVSPTTSKDRCLRIASKCTGFLYVVSVLGVTGERDSVDSARSVVKRVKSFLKLNGSDFELPVCVGFGISNPDQVFEVIRIGADGAICGSAVEAIVEKNLGDTNKLLRELEGFVVAMRSAAKSARK